MTFWPLPCLLAIEHQSCNIFNLTNEQLLILTSSFPSLQKLIETKTQEDTQIRAYVSAVTSSSEPLSLDTVYVDVESQNIKEYLKWLKGENLVVC